MIGKVSHFLSWVIFFMSIVLSLADIVAGRYTFTGMLAIIGWGFVIGYERWLGV